MQHLDRPQRRIRKTVEPRELRHRVERCLRLLEPIALRLAEPRERVVAVSRERPVAAAKQNRTAAEHS